jgi:hypothetical protein
VLFQTSEINGEDTEKMEENIIPERVLNCCPQGKRDDRGPVKISID